MNDDRSTMLIRSLQDPAVYDHPTAGIEVIQTHISWVVLTGPYAYKLKKPVDLGFVDFTTLERRRFYCGEEIRLNRRLASELYLGVVPISGTPAAPVLNGDGEPIEFAVKMPQFPQDALLSHVLERGQLLPVHIDVLARDVADFHGQIETTDPQSRFGTPDAVYEPMAENFRHLAPICAGKRGRLPCGEQLAGRLERLRDWSEREFARLHDEFAARRRDGFVRECHGDMHLGNMILDQDGSITIFDCIEFNESFRWIDVISEAAFLVMDFEDRGRPDLARRFLNAWLERTGDYAGLGVLPFYLAYRALVRAKVAGLRLDQPDLDDGEQERLRREFESYIALAERCTEARRPMLIITHGLSGSGKTTGTQPLVEELGTVRIRSDVERKRLVGLDPLARSGAGVGEALYSAETTRRTYARLAELAAAVLEAGFPAIVDATFLRRADRDTFRRLAEQLSVTFVILDFQADEETLRRRIIHREAESRDASEATLEVLAHQLRNREPLGADEAEWTLANGERPDVAELKRRVSQTPSGSPVENWTDRVAGSSRTIRSSEKS